MKELEMICTVSQREATIEGIDSSSVLRFHRFPMQMASSLPAEMNSLPKRRRLSFESEFLAAIEGQSIGHGLNIGCCMETRGKKIHREEFAKLFKERISDVYPRLTLLWQWIKHVPWALYMLLVFSVIPDSYTSLRPTFGKRGRSEVRCGTEVSLEDLKIVSKATGSKINDVILALLAGTARRYLLAEALKKGVDEIRDPARLRMGFQFTANMRSLSGEPSIGGGGNESWVFAVPVCLDADLQKRIKNVQLQTGRLKRSPAFLFGKVFTRCCGFFMNFPIFRRLLINCICGERYIFGKTLTVTNVPGPRAPRSVCGEAIQRLSVYVSHSQTFSVITYNGKVSTIIVTDSEWVDAELMRECYNEEVEQAVLAFRSAEKGIEGLSHTRS